MTATAAVVAVAASIMFGWSTAAMHSSAFNAPGGVQRILPLLRHVLRQPLWLSGMAASLAGLVLHALALSLGSIVVVQPIIATGLLWSLGFSELLHHRRPSRAVVVWGGLVAVGLVVFFSFDVWTPGRSSPSAGGAAAMLTAGAAAVGAGVLAAGGGSRHRSGLWLGGAAGVVFGLVAGTLKATTGAHDAADLFASWPVWMLVLLGATGFVLNQAAYNKVPLAQSLPILNVTNPLVALLYGYVAFDERPSGNVAAAVLQFSGLAITLIGVFVLARVEASELHPS